MRSFPPQITPHLRLGWRWPAAFRALRHRNFRLFFFGQLISVSGIWLQSTAQQWLVYRLTGSKFSLGAVNFASFFPVLLLSLFMGVIIDRFPRRRILIITQSWFMLLAGLLALLTFLDVVEYNHILLLAFLLGIANALDMPARQAIYIDLVSRDEILNAIALNSSVFNGARIIGPAIGGLIVGLFGEAPAFALNAVSYLAVILALIAMRLPPFKSPTGRESGWVDLKRGLNYLIRDRRVFGLVTMVALYSLFGIPYLVLLPALARDVLQVGPEGFGVLMAAQGGGALISALSLASAGEKRHKGHQLLINRGLLALALIVLGLTRQLPLAMLALAFAGFSMITQLAITNSLIQQLVPDEIRGRVMSAFTWALGGFFPIGSLLFGAIGDWLGTSQAIVVAAACSAVLAILNRHLFPETLELT